MCKFRYEFLVFKSHTTHTSGAKFLVRAKIRSQPLCCKKYTFDPPPSRIFPQSFKILGGLQIVLTGFGGLGRG